MVLLDAADDLELFAFAVVPPSPFKAISVMEHTDGLKNSVSPDARLAGQLFVTTHPPLSPKCLPLCWVLRPSSACCKPVRVELTDRTRPDWCMVFT